MTVHIAGKSVSSGKSSAVMKSYLIAIVIVIIMCACENSTKCFRTLRVLSARPCIENADVKDMFPLAKNTTEFQCSCVTSFVRCVLQNIDRSATQAAHIIR